MSSSEQQQQKPLAEIIKLPERIKRQDALLTKVFTKGDFQTSLITALYLVKYCNTAAIDTLFPPNSCLSSAPWEVACHASVTFSRPGNARLSNAIQTSRSLTIFPVAITPRSLQRAAQLLSLAQQYLSDVVSKIITPATTTTQNLNCQNNTNNPFRIPDASPNCERLASAWPYIVTLSHQGIVAFYGGRQRLALGYVEAAISMVKNCLGIHESSNSNNNYNTTTTRSSSPQHQRARSASASAYRSRSVSSPLIAFPNQQKQQETDPSSSFCQLSNLRTAAVRLTMLMNGNKDCAIQLIVLLLNYSRILVSLNKYNHARDSAALAKEMMEDLEDVEVAKASEVLAEQAMNESQDWPSLLNGRTNLPLLQSFCSYTLADVDVLCKPTNIKVLESSLLMFRDADVAAAAADLPSRDQVNGGYRQMIFEKARMVAEQLELVNKTLEKEKEVQRQTVKEMRDRVREKRSSSPSPYSFAGYQNNKNINNSSPSPLPKDPKHGNPEIASSIVAPSSSSSSSSSAILSSICVASSSVSSGISKRPSTASSASTSKPKSSSSFTSTSTSSTSTSTNAMIKSSLEHRMRRGCCTTTSSVRSSSSTTTNNKMMMMRNNIGLKALTERSSNILRRPSSGATAMMKGRGSSGKVQFVGGNRSPSPFV